MKANALAVLSQAHPGAGQPNPPMQHHGGSSKECGDDEINEEQRIQNTPQLLPTHACCLSQCVRGQSHSTHRYPMYTQAEMSDYWSGLFKPEDT